MLMPRLIPTLLISQGGLVKTMKFREPKYLGDPINAVRIFNEKEADELIVLDIDSSMAGTEPNYQLVEHIAKECRMPLCYGGGIKSAKQAEKIINLGVEKVAVSSAAILNPDIISDMSSSLGTQSIVVVLDVHSNRKIFSKELKISTHNATRLIDENPIEIAKDFEFRGAGEIVFNSVDLDGSMTGYNLELAKKAKAELSIPFTMLGGAGSLDDIKALVEQVGIVGASASSIFVYKGKYKAVLISYPTQSEKAEILKHAKF